MLNNQADLPVDAPVKCVELEERVLDIDRRVQRMENQFHYLFDEMERISAPVTRFHRQMERVASVAKDVAISAAFVLAGAAATKLYMEHAQTVKNADELAATSAGYTVNTLADTSSCRIFDIRSPSSTVVARVHVPPRCKP